MTAAEEKALQDTNRAMVSTLETKEQRILGLELQVELLKEKYCRVVERAIEYKRKAELPSFDYLLRHDGD